jgi:hypothetical protein
VSVQGARALFCLALFASGCIKVPNRVKASFCAQPAPANHFGSGADARSCCPGPPRVPRFGTLSEPCAR